MDQTRLAIAHARVPTTSGNLEHLGQFISVFSSSSFKHGGLIRLLLLGLPLAGRPIHVLPLDLYFVIRSGILS